MNKSEESFSVEHGGALSDKYSYVICRDNDINICGLHYLVDGPTACDISGFIRPNIRLDFDHVVLHTTAVPHTVPVLKFGILTTFISPHAPMTCTLNAYIETPIDIEIANCRLHLEKYTLTMTCVGAQDAYIAAHTTIAIMSPRSVLSTKSVLLYHTYVVLDNYKNSVYPLRDNTEQLVKAVAEYYKGIEVPTSVLATYYLAYINDDAATADEKSATSTRFAAILGGARSEMNYQHVISRLDDEHAAATVSQYSFLHKTIRARLAACHDEFLAKWSAPRVKADKCLTFLFSTLNARDEFHRAFRAIRAPSSIRETSNRLGSTYLPIRYIGKCTPSFLCDYDSTQYIAHADYMDFKAFPYPAAQVPTFRHSRLETQSVYIMLKPHGLEYRNGLECVLKQLAHYLPTFVPGATINLKTFSMAHHTFNALYPNCLKRPYGNDWHIYLTSGLCGMLEIRVPDSHNMAHIDLINMIRQCTQLARQQSGYMYTRNITHSAENLEEAKLFNDVVRQIVYLHQTDDARDNVDVGTLLNPWKYVMADDDDHTSSPRR